MADEGYPALGDLIFQVALCTIGIGLLLFISRKAIRDSERLASARRFAHRREQQSLLRLFEEVWPEDEDDGRDDCAADAFDLGGGPVAKGAPPTAALGDAKMTSDGRPLCPVCLEPLLRRAVLPRTSALLAVAADPSAFDAPDAALTLAPGQEAARFGGASDRSESSASSAAMQQASFVAEVCDVDPSVASSSTTAGDGVIRFSCPGMHEFHRRCIVRWVSKGRSTCPICKFDFRTASFTLERASDCAHGAGDVAAEPRLPVTPTPLTPSFRALEVAGSRDALG
mmetsp:Transcript_7133/g.20222  ORF Transcript_7133/g.20222 Transcript_7133/m.20222 type:complete len:284 (-) Transcript_7133:164-1015(-)